jgi:hypothetical protein
LGVWRCGGVVVGGGFPLRSNIPRSALCATLDTYNFTISIFQGAFWGLMFGLVIGVIRMIMDFSYPAPLCMEEDTRPAIVAKVGIFKIK